MSRIPTDLYLIRNPSLGIEADPATGLMQVVEKKSKRVLNANKFKSNIIERDDVISDDQGI